MDPEEREGGHVKHVDNVHLRISVCHLYQNTVTGLDGSPVDEGRSSQLH